MNDYTQNEIKELVEKANELLRTGHAEHGIEILAKTYGPAHPYVAIGYNALGSQQYDKEDWPEAKSAQEQALIIWEYNNGRKSIEVADCAYNLGRIYGHMGKYDDATLMHREALILRRELLKDDHLDIGASLLGLGAVLLATDTTEEAAELFKEGIHLYERAETIDCMEYAACKANLLLCQQKIVQKN